MNGPVSHEKVIPGGAEAQAVQVREAGAPRGHVVQNEVEANTGIDGDVKKVTVVRLRRIVQEMTERKRAAGKQGEIEAKRKEGDVEVAVHIEVTVYTHLGCRP